MRKNVFNLRNEAILKRYQELKSLGRNNAQCFDIMMWEFWLEARTIRDICFGRYKERAQNISKDANQMSMF